MNATRLLRAALVVHLCVGTPWTAASVSCPCRPIDQCPNGSEGLAVSMPCESERLTRCCSTVLQPIQSANAREPGKNRVVDLEQDSTEKSPSTGDKATIPEYYFTTTSRPNLEKSTAATPASSTTAEDVATKSGVDSQHKPRQVRPKPRPIDLRLLKRTASSPPRYKVEGRPSQQEVTPEDQRTIQQAIRFESRRISPRKLVASAATSANEERKIARNRNLPVHRKSSPSRNYYSDLSAKLSASGRAPEKSSGPAERKTSLGTLLTLDGASVRAINENANSPSELDDGASIRSLSDAEDAENIKRVVRSHASELDDRFAEERSYSSAGVSAKRDEKKEVPTARGFKRPPRVLPIRNLRNEEQTSGKFANSRERARSLFDKSNEARRKQVSFIINRNDTRMKKFAAVNNNLTSVKRADDKYNDFERNATSVMEEAARFDDKSVLDSGEVS